ncbi:hypothetical protein AAHC03_021170 [Spirometra sp. Aus1]
MDQISELKVTEPYSVDTMTSFQIKIRKTQTKPQCVFQQHELLFKEVGCTISTARVDIFLEQMVKDMAAADGRWHRADEIQIAISGAVLNATLNETTTDSGNYALNVIKLVGLSIQDITSITEAQKNSLPTTHENNWKIWVIENTERLLRRAFLAHGVVQCRWQQNILP